MATKESAEVRRQKKLFEAARRQLRRNLPRALKGLAKNSGWRTARGVLYREADGWFFEVTAIPWIVEARTPARLHSKPMGLDPLFWAIVGLDENINQPLSFRAFGAFTCRTPPRSEVDIPEEGGDPERIAKRLLDWADGQIASLRGLQSIDGFVEFIRNHPNQVERQSHLPALITGMLLQGRYGEALTVSKIAQENGHHGGFRFMNVQGSKTFIELALDWLTTARQTGMLN